MRLRKKSFSRIASVLWSGSVVQAVIRVVDNISRIDTIHSHFSTVVSVAMSPILTLTAVVLGALMLWYASLAEEPESLLELPAYLKIEKTRFPKRLVLWSLSIAFVCGALLSGLLKWLPHRIQARDVPQATMPAELASKSTEAHVAVPPPSKDSHGKVLSGKGVTLAALRSKQKSWTTNIDQTYDWSKAVKQIGPPSEADADAMRPQLVEEDRIRRMDTKELLAYYDKQAEDLQLFFVRWDPKQNDYDSHSCQGPENDTPEAKKRCDELNKLENTRLSNYQKWRYHDLPEARGKDFKESFSLVGAAVNVLNERCAQKAITPDQPPVTADNAYGLAEYFRTYRKQCLGGN